MLFASSASVKYGYSVPLGTYAVFFNEPFPLQNAVDGTIRGERQTQFPQFPFDGGNPNLGKGFGL
jgi:hypothetical protein